MSATTFDGHMSFFKSKHFNRFISIPWRRLAIWLALLCVVCLGYAIWTPGAEIVDGRHDLHHNGIWAQHAWIGDDVWFNKYKKNAAKPQFRDKKQVVAFAHKLRKHHIKDVFPHLAPTNSSGALLQVDAKQMTLFLEVLEQERVMPWIGGVYKKHVHPDLVVWRRRFIQDIVTLLNTYPKLSGVHLNIEPWPSGEPDMLILLDELRAQLPKGRLLSVAAYPPPVPVVGNLKVHWTPAYIAEVSRRVDHMAFMNYDSGLKLQKLYVALLVRWTKQILDSTKGTEVLLGLPVYDDAGVAWHDPRVENLSTSLAGTHKGLMQYEQLPSHYRGVSLYSDWEMQPDEWKQLQSNFLKATP